jgi:hypothetical protein
MPGAGRYQFQWKERPPLYWSVLAIIFFIYCVALVFSPYFLAYISTPRPSSGHAHALTVDGGIRYMGPLLWWCHDKGGWVCGALFLMLILIMFLKRDQIERIR